MTSPSPTHAVIVVALLAAIVLAAGALASGAHAETLAEQLLHNHDLLDHPPASCADKAALNTVELQQCAAVAFRDEDAALNKVYVRAVAAHSAKATEELRQAQRLWLQWREHHCLWESARYEGGSQQPVAFADCLVSVTKARVQQLGDALKP
jgi:uncharacterized protein YecT (DUF1311 family)